MEVLLQGVSARPVGTGEVMLEAQLNTGVTEEVWAGIAAVIGERSQN